MGDYFHIYLPLINDVTYLSSKIKIAEFLVLFFYSNSKVLPKTIYSVLPGYLRFRVEMKIFLRLGWIHIHPTGLDMFIYDNQVVR